MTLSSSTQRMDYTGNGTADTFAYSFKIFDEDDLVVTVVDSSDDSETTLTITTDYTVTGVGETSGGNVVLVNSAQDWLDGDGDLDTGYSLVIRRVRSLVQNTDIRNQGDFYPESYEDALDHIIMIAQQQQEEIDRAVKLNVGSSLTITLPTPADGYVLQWSGSGGTIVNAAYDTASLNAAIASAQAAQSAAETAETNAETAETNASSSASSASSSASSASASAAAAAASAASFDQTAIEDTDGDTKIHTEKSADEDLIRFDIAGTEQIRLTDGALIPTTDNDVDLGGVSNEFKDLYIDGTAYVDSLTLTSGATVTSILDEDAMGSDSATALATQQSIKAYADAITSFPDYVAGDTLIQSADTQQDSASQEATPTKEKEIVVGRDGELRIKFDHQRTSGSGTARARVYRNGVAVGTLNSTTSSWATISEDISGWARGDLCQLYVWTDGSGSTVSSVRNFQLFEDVPLDTYVATD